MYAARNSFTAVSMRALSAVCALCRSGSFPGPSPGPLFFGCARVPQCFVVLGIVMPNVLRRFVIRLDDLVQRNMVSAWACEQRLVLGQLKTAEKSNEITAIPLLLELLELRGCIVTIDAMGCQTAVAAQIMAQEADYVLSLKGNQGLLHEEVEEYFAWAERTQFKDVAYDYCATLEKDHGRIEGRRCWVTEDTDWFTEKARWAGLRSFIMVEAEREALGQAATCERRYFISSLPADAKQALRAVRNHWQVENSLHWVLDVGLREDACRTRSAHAPENLATLRHMAVNLLKQERSCKLGIKSKRLKAGWDESYMLKVLNI